jgi:hypothetical protein
MDKVIEVRGSKKIIIEKQNSSSTGTSSDISLVVTEDDQVQFNIFDQPTKSNLFINDSTYFENVSYLIQNINGNWRLVWLDEFKLKTTDRVILRKQH